jgi:hypothetical protein
MDENSPFKPIASLPKKGEARKMTKISSSPPSPLWPSYLYRTNLTLLSGEGGVGKTTVFYDLISRAAMGGPWPDETTTFAPLSVLLILVEDSAGHAVDRIRQAGCDEEAAARVNIIDRAHSLQYSDILSTPPPLDLIVFETLDAHLKAGANMMDPIHARQNLAPLQDVAEFHNAAIIGGRHWNKREGSAIKHRSMGSNIIAAVSRVALDLYDGLSSARRPVKVLATSKTNYTSIPDPLCLNLVSIDPYKVRVDWLGHDPNAVPIGGSIKIERCVRFLLSILPPATPLPARQMKSAISAAGFGLHTMEEAQTQLGVKAYQQPGSGWVWERS